MLNTSNCNEKWIFITFGDGNEEIRAAARRLTKQAEENGAFSLVLNFDSATIPGLLEKLGRKFDTTARGERGFGYWRWKPVLIEAVYDELLSFGSNYDGLIYVDAGCEIPQNMVSRRRFKEIFNATLSSSIVASETTHLQREYTKNLVFTHLDPDMTTSGEFQMQATWIAIRKSAESRNFIKEWARLALYADGLLFNDELGEEYDYFKSPRHDQAVFSILFRQNNFNPFNMYYYYRFGSVRNSIIPIWTSRNRSGISSMKYFVNWNLTGFVGLSAHLIPKLKATAKTLLCSPERNQHGEN
jgi:hypothetical protein